MIISISINHIHHCISPDRIAHFAPGTLRRRQVEQTARNCGRRGALVQLCQEGGRFRHQTSLLLSLQGFGYCVVISSFFIGVIFVLFQGLCYFYVNYHNHHKNHHNHHHPTTTTLTSTTAATLITTTQLPTTTTTTTTTQHLRKCIANMNMPSVEGHIGQPPFEKPCIAKVNKTLIINYYFLFQTNKFSLFLAPLKLSN